MLNKENRIREKNRQAGFSIVEIIIAGTLVMGMLLASSVFNFSGENGKAANLFRMMEEVGNAALRFKADTGVMAKTTAALFMKAKADATGTFEGVSAQPLWQGPYISNNPGAGDDYSLQELYDGAAMSITKITTGMPSSASIGYEVKAGPLNREMAVRIVNICTGKNFELNRIQNIGYEDSVSGVSTSGLCKTSGDSDPETFVHFLFFQR